MQSLGTASPCQCQNHCSNNVNPYIVSLLDSWTARIPPYQVYTVPFRDVLGKMFKENELQRLAVLLSRQSAETAAAGMWQSSSTGS